jgi:hypothetical protein
VKGERCGVELCPSSCEFWEEVMQTAMKKRGIALDNRHFTIIEMLKKESLTMSGVASRLRIHRGTVQNWIDTITYHDPCLVEDDEGLLSYVENIRGA